MSYFLHPVGQLQFRKGKEETIHQILKERKRGKELEFSYLYLTNSSVFSFSVFRLLMIVWDTILEKILTPKSMNLQVKWR